MTKTNRFWKFVLISLSGILICVSGLLFFIWLRLPLYQKTAFMEMGQENIYLILCLGFIVIGSLWAVFDITYNRYILPLKRISAEAEMIYNSNPSHRIQIKGSRDILCMAEVINDFADMFENLNKNITQQILSARQETEKERNLLAAIMGELPQGIIICNKNGRVILFNSMARSFFTQTGESASGEQFLGLGRSVFHLIDKSLIAHAMDEILEQINTPDSTVGSFFITPIISGLLIAAEAIPVLDTDKGITGFILMLQDVSEKIKKYQIIDRELNRFSSHLKNHSDLEQFEKMGTRIRSSFFTKLPSTQITLDAFLPSVQKKSGYLDDIRVNIYNPVPATRFLADTYSMTQGFVFIFRELSELTGLTEFDLVVEQDEGTIIFTIEWEGPFCTNDQINAMLQTQLNGLPSLGYVLKFNNTRLNWTGKEPETCSKIILLARAGMRQKSGIVKQSAPVISNSRPEFYDFNLFNLEESRQNILETPLKHITYTVFDTETTGLNPDGGDEIISIGAVRIVNNRIVFQDYFEELVNPKRDIPIDSYKIHGISYEMVKEKQDIQNILPVFKQFTANTVLLGHNLAFDLKMFKVKEKITGVKFTNPVLDTLLLSALLHPVHEKHDIENIARRLGVNIIGRHTALGDAITTAEIFIKLLPILNANGILTLKDAVTAAKKTYYARLKY